VAKQIPGIGPMVRETIVAAVREAGGDGDALEEPERQPVVRVVEHAAVKRNVPLHCVRPEAVHAHDIVDGPVWRFDPSRKPARADQSLPPPAPCESTRPFSPPLPLSLDPRETLYHRKHSPSRQKLAPIDDRD